MAESPRAGSPVGSHGKTTTPEPDDPRLIPGGSFDAPAIGMNAVDREDLPSYGEMTADYRDTPGYNPGLPPRH
jgi:hypothetical protein